MKVAICTGNQSIMLNIVSMVAKNGCKFTKVNNYSILNVKGHDMCIFDLDNLKDSLDKIKEDVPNMGEILLLGISRSEEILDTFRPLMNVEKKPFLVDVFVQYKGLVKETVNSEYLVNKDSERIYDSFGVKISDLLNEQTLSSFEMETKLKDKIDISNMDIDGENDFFDKLGIKDIVAPKQEILKQSVPSSINIFEDNALLMYRTKKLKGLNLSVAEIENKLKELNDKNILMQSKPKKDTTNEILEKLKGGYFSKKRENPISSPEIPIIEPISTPKDLEPVQKVISSPIIPKEINSPTIISEETPIIEPINIEAEVIDDKYTIPKEELPVINNIPEVKTDKPSLLEDIKQDVVKDEPKEYLDVKISPEKEQALQDRLNKIKEMRNIKAQREIHEDKVSGEVIHPIPPKKEEPPSSDVPDGVMDDIDKLYELDTAVTKLGGGKHNISNNSDDIEVKDINEVDLRTKLPSASLFELLKDKLVTGGVKEDVKEKKKKEIEQKSKPPRR